MLLTWSRLNAQLGSVVATRNGPRYWTMDFIVSMTGLNDQEFFGTVEMRLAAYVQLTALTPPSPYTKNRVERDTEFHFYVGTPVFELIGSDGNIYIMQSYSVALASDQTFANLASFGRTRIVT